MHANRCLVEERNCREITTPAVTSPTEPKTAHQSYALCLQMDFPSTLRGLEMGWTLAWGGPWRRTSPGTPENEAHPQTGSAALGENSTAPMTPQPQEVEHKRPRAGGPSAPLIWMGKVNQGEVRDHQHQLKSQHFSPRGAPGKTSPSPHNISREAKT